MKASEPVTVPEQRALPVNVVTTLTRTLPITLISQPQLEARLPSGTVIPLHAAYKHDLKAALNNKHVKIVDNCSPVLNALARLRVPCPQTIDMRLYARDRNHYFTPGTHDHVLQQYLDMSERPVRPRLRRQSYNHLRHEYLRGLSIANVLLRTAPLSRAQVVEGLKQAHLPGKSVLNFLVHTGILEEQGGVVSLVG